MTTFTAGKLGGQYSVKCVTDDIYVVQGLLHGQLHTIFKGEYEFATKLMDYCSKHDDEAQAAIHDLYYDASPTKMIELHESARDNQEAKPRRRVEVWVRVATDVLESENAIEQVSSRISQVAGMAGLVITQLEVHYAYPEEQFIHPPTREEQLLQDSLIRPLDSSQAPQQEPASGQVYKDTPVQLVTDPSDRPNVPQSPMTFTQPRS